MSYLSPTTGYSFIAIFALAITAITYGFSRWHGWQTKDGFLLANRQVGWLLGGFSIASSWIWAPALFVSVQTAYQMGLAGIFWFTAPNVLALLIFAILAPKIRSLIPTGYTFTQYIRYRLGSDRVHRMFLAPYFLYQLTAVIVQLYAGGSLLALLTGIHLTIIMPILAAFVLGYTVLSGFRASVVTDFVQLGLIYLVGLIVLPLAWHAAGGAHAISAGFQGTQHIKTMLDPGIAFSFGIVTSIGLIAGSISDQSNWQRAFALRKPDLVKAFLFGSILFAIVPIAMSTLGFLGANPGLHIALPAGVDSSMIGVQAVAQLLPRWAVALFVVMLLSGLSSAMDAGLSAASSLWVTDVTGGGKGDHHAVRQARQSMIGITLAGLAVSLGVLYIPHFGLQQLFWISNTLAACVMVPTVLGLYWNRLSERGAFWGALIGFVIGFPLFIASNIINRPTWIVGSSLFIVAISAVFALTLPRKTAWQPAKQLV